jgi:hypothetical protein
VLRERRAVKEGEIKNINLRCSLCALVEGRKLACVMIARQSRVALGLSVTSPRRMISHVQLTRIKQSFPPHRDVESFKGGKKWKEKREKVRHK